MKERKAKMKASHAVRSSLVLERSAGFEHL
jgi:hypothetical protein